MHTSRIPFEKISALSFKDVTYQTEPEKLKDFCKFAPDTQGLRFAIDERAHFPVDRELLVAVLGDYYSDIEVSELQYHNIYKLKDQKTYTVTTAHQPALLGGPAYYFYKICSVIRLSETLKKLYPEYHFVPVFVNGSEDHDFDEVKTVHLFGKSITWDTDQKGPVGRFNLSGLEEVVQQVAEILGTSDHAVSLNKIFAEALEKATSYNDFVFRWLNAMFRDYGLIVMNMDDARLKRCFIPVMKKEIMYRESESLVQQSQEKLLEIGFKPQAHAREINLFYMSAQSRERIYAEDDVFKINNTDLSFTEMELLDLLENHPERFSPNVVLRPMYQMTVLPDIAYIGGGGEVSYWLERKAQFAHFGVFYPVIMRRNSAMIIPKGLQKTIEKHQLSEDDILLDEDKLVTVYLERSSDADFHLDSEMKSIQEAFQKIAEKAGQIDATLEPYVLGESQKAHKTIENIEGRLKRSLKQKEEVSLNQIKALRSKLFPSNGLQERNDSFLQFLVSEDSDFLREIIDAMNPLEKEFLFIYL
ncbi:MAG: bacillithiol biosynthesis cysteine-adding enzyme BshC [Saprospiraceae bacterium]